jgi:hypothetical protein
MNGYALLREFGFKAAEIAEMTAAEFAEAVDECGERDRPRRRRMRGGTLMAADVDVTKLPARPPREGEFGPVPEIDQLSVGDLVVAYSRGAERVAMIEKIGRSNVGVVYTTKGAWDEATKIHAGLLSRDPDWFARREAEMAAKNYDHSLRESDPATARYAVAAAWKSEEQAERERARNREIVTEERDVYIARYAEAARRKVESDRAEATEGGPERYVHVTRKTVKHADLIGWARA